MRILVSFLGVALLAYAAIAALVYFQQSRFIYPAPQQIAPLADGFEDVQLETADGLTLRAFYRAAEAGKPTAIYFHGNGGTLSGSVAATERLRNRGYGLLLVEYRGYGGNAGEPSEEGFYHDGRAAIAFAEAQGLAHSDLVLIGNSIGGGTATQMATEIEPKALILVSAFSSLPDVASEKMGWLPVRMMARDQFDNAAKLPQVTAPILIQHGEGDELIPMHHGERLAEAASAATFQTFPNAGHDLAFWPEPQSAQYVWLTEFDATAAADTGATNVPS